MNKTLTRITLLAATLGACASAMADPFSARFTARDVYFAYTGAANGSGLTLLGGDAASAVAEDYSGNVAAGSYVYVVAWTSAGQEDQAFQGSVTSGSTMAYTGTNLWQALTLPAPFPGFNGTQLALPVAQLEAEIASGSWGPTAAVAPAGTWGDRHGGGLASWVWSDTFNPNPAGSYAIFRTQVGAPVSSVPEPTTQALALLALLAGGVARRVRSIRVRSTRDQG